MKYLLANNNSLYKAMLFYIIYIIQFHLVISSINAILTGKYLFKIYNKDFSIKNILLIEILFLPIILFPYSNFFNGYKIMISIIQNIIIIISIISLYIYVRKQIYELFIFLNKNNKDISIISFKESNELLRIYGLVYNLCSVLLFFGLFYYAIRFFYIFLMNKSIIILLIISLVLIVIEESIVFIIFFCLTYINCLISNYYITQVNKKESIDNDKSKRKNNLYKFMNLENTQEQNTLIKIDDLYASDDIKKVMNKKYQRPKTKK
jgi:hypothetical protein